MWQRGECEVVVVADEVGERVLCRHNDACQLVVREVAACHQSTVVEVQLCQVVVREVERLSYVLCFLSVGSGVTAGESLNSISVDLIAPSHYFFSHIHGWDIEFVVGLFFGGVLLRDSVFFCCHPDLSETV